MSSASRFLHPETIQRISRMDLRARHVVEGFLAGLHRSRHFGNSVEFRQHREYVAGDDPRYVDWKVWARQDRLYVKQFEEETNLRLNLLIDVSASMRYGSRAMSKHEYGCTVAASLAYLALRRQDAVGCMAFDDAVRMTVPFRSKRNHLDSLLQTFDIAEPAQKTDLSLILQTAAEKAPPRGMTVLISDLLADRDGLFKGLRLLRGRSHDVLVFHIMDDDELDFPFNGPTRFHGLESIDILRCNPRALRQGYLEALNSYLEEIRRGCRNIGADYVLLRTSQPLDAALAKFLSNRMATNNRK